MKGRHWYWGQRASSVGDVEVKDDDEFWSAVTAASKKSLWKGDVCRTSGEYTLGPGVGGRIDQDSYGKRHSSPWDADVDASGRGNTPLAVGSDDGQYIVSPQSFETEPGIDIAFIACPVSRPLLLVALHTPCAELCRQHNLYC
jgi:hypothetical protein